MPGTTLEAFFDHGRVAGDTIRSNYDSARRVLQQLAGAGIDFADVTDQLEREGLTKFEASWGELNATVTAELKENKPQ